MAATAQSFSQLIPASVDALAERDQALADARAAKAAIAAETAANLQQHNTEVAQAHANRMAEINSIIAGIR